MFAEAAFAVVCLSGALALRPWRMLRADAQPQLLTPLLASLAILPWVWALPSLRSMPLQLQLSGAGLVLLMLGWPLAVPALAGVGLAAWLVSPMPWEQALSLTVWQGLVPATLALALGALLRRYVADHPFIYILGRGFLGTVACLFAAAALRQALGHTLPGTEAGLGMVARWLMAWGDGFVTGMLCAVFVAFRPGWLATWSDRRYLHG
ncbi:MAG TPA: hypothetical protein VFH35_04180 [Ramlibacter sp.]|nr:hypothetical protein [Ramlibacter sp.]